MVFSSLPLNHHFDSWHQQQVNQNQLTIDQNPNNDLQQFSSQSQAGSSNARLNSMVERARIAKVPLPEAALKCPRCDSINTKFCYFNNYSLTQPRHFCKSCRRYWTRGGALRNVPVGGGFRRNKRSKSNGGRSKSTVVVSDDNNMITSHSSYSNPSKFLNYGQISGFSSNLPILSPLQSLGDYNTNNVGLEFGGIQMSSNGGILDPWRTSCSSSQQAQQFPFLINTRDQLEQSSNVLYPLLEEVNEAQQESSEYSTQLRSKPLMHQTIDVKGEEKDQDQDRSKNYLENMNRNSTRDNEYTSWGLGNNNIVTSWTGFTSNNSTSHVSF